MERIPVVRTYLSLPSDVQLIASHVPAGASLRPLRPCPIETARRLYQGVGADYAWRDRLAWSEAQWEAHLSDPGTRLVALELDGVEAGYFELVRHADDSVELAYFGLLRFAQGRGIGKWLLEQAITTAREWRPTRLWVHTCTLDGPSALPNYLARGFEPYRTEHYEIDAPLG